MPGQKSSVQTLFRDVNRHLWMIYGLLSITFGSLLFYVAVIASSFFMSIGMFLIATAAYCLYKSSYVLRITKEGELIEKQLFQKPRTLKVGEIEEITFRVFYPLGSAMWRAEGGHRNKKEGELSPFLGSLCSCFCGP